MDILLDKKGDLFLSGTGDILITNSVAQKISIRLKWFLSEWRWNKSEGMPYMEKLFIKNPDLYSFESIVRSKIFEVDEVTKVKEVSITADISKREATIKYVALTDQEIIKGEVSTNWLITE